MDEQTDDALRAIEQDPADLDGHTIEQLADYLDAGRTPPDPSIDSSPACRHALAALERLRAVAIEELVDSPGREPEGDDWVARVMERIALDAHSGADFVLADGPDARLVMTEGALRALVRATGDDQPEFLVGRVRFGGDLSAPIEPITISVHVTVMRGVRIPAAVDRLRRRILDEVVRHTRFQLLRIDVRVQDLDEPDQERAA